ncbi:ribosome maturation factor RimM [Paenibacillus sp. IB182496]|uniref:Ribosome maturation factor RimM n=1 Tax=Paenibacillus sabuli TaxID=2772509 RepID=A0A927BUH1_9BACL|nr:ribosome maturation factor RimM [Paenibacillus sabuli]MBD2846111.1 ribosome maturation factor RimM [Paenibacillus sabuli]
MTDQWLNVGKLVNTHGLRGEIKVLPQTDFPDVRFAKGSRLTLLRPDGADSREVEVAGAREVKGMYVVKLKGIETINEIESCKGWDVKVPAEQRVELEDGEYYHRDIIGSEVVTEGGELLGTIGEILQPGANDVWSVSRPGEKPLLLPVIDEVVLGVDIAAKRVTVRLMEGMV